jgi:hypothetical protein
METGVWKGWTANWETGLWAGMTVKLRDRLVKRMMEDKFKFASDSFALFCFYPVHFRFQHFAVSLRCETNENIQFFASKHNTNFRLDLIFRFGSENDGGPQAALLCAVIAESTVMWQPKMCR